MARRRPLPRRVATVSWYGGSAAYGGTPSDASVWAPSPALKTRGLEVALNPFIMMDIPSGNGLPDPWTLGPIRRPIPARAHHL